MEILDKMSVRNRYQNRRILLYPIKSSNFLKEIVLASVLEAYEFSRIVGTDNVLILNRYGEDVNGDSNDYLHYNCLTNLLSLFFVYHSPDHSGLPKCNMLKYMTEYFWGLGCREYLDEYINLLANEKFIDKKPIDAVRRGDLIYHDTILDLTSEG